MASSIDAIPAKKLEELLECSFCLETLNDPRTLPCFHSFCKCCLEKFVQGQGNRDENPDKGIKNFECPICRSEFTVDPKEGAAGIGTNYFIRNMLDVMEVESRVKGIPCPHCKNPSVARCVTCEFFLCEKCLEGHNNYLGFQKHSVLSMDELSEPENRFKIRGTPRCQEHDDALKHFCETCEELICRDCKDYNHNDHKCSPLKKAAEQKTEELNTHYQKLTEEVTEVNKALEAMKGVDKSLEDNVKTAKQKIGARKEAILEAVRRNLDEKEKSLLREIDIIYLFKHEAIEEQLKDTEAYVKTIQNSVDMCAGLLKNGNPVEIASSHKLLCTNIENVRKERPENLKPDNDGGIPFNSSPMDGLDAEIEKISQRMGNIKSTEAGRAWCFNTSNKLRVVIYQGNIIKEDADIIVSSCDSKLSHARGVSLAIANAGGPSIRKESNEYLEKHAGVLASGNVATIGPGLLKCKKILLGVSPYWEKHGKDGSIKRIRQVLGQIFQTASTLKAKSVAMPAIGSGLCGMPKDVCAQTLLSFFKELGDQNLTSNIKRPFEIRLVDIEKTTIDVLVKKFTNGCLKK